MPDKDDNPQTPRRIQDFIFSRELSEVYLLLDFLSGRSDKSLAAAFDGLEGYSGSDFVERICEIPWPPKPEEPQLNAKAAAILMLAKDQLNRAARPSSGSSIGFSLLVAGDRDPGWFSGLFLRHTRRPPAKDASLDSWKNEIPSRLSLASHAFPGMVGAAWWFRVYNRTLIVGLLLWLILTCLLSWNIAAGHSILVRLGGAKADLAATNKSIVAEEDKSPKTFTNPANENVTLRYCDRPLLFKKWEVDKVELEQFESASQSELCRELKANYETLQYVRNDLNKWINTWHLPQEVISLLCGSAYCESKKTQEKGEDTATQPLAVMSAAKASSPEEKTANPSAATLPSPGSPIAPSKSTRTTDPYYSSKRVTPEDFIAVLLLDVLAGAILPIVYGILGAGAAAVRGITRKISNSVLSPSDMIVSMAQLALGAVVGACIGLFVTPSNGGVGQGGLLSGATTLSASALSFVAGFSVDAVFIALEGFVKRIFNTDKTEGAGPV